MEASLLSRTASGRGLPRRKAASRISTQFIAAALFRRARRFLPLRTAARLRRLPCRLTGYDASPCQARPLGISAALHGQLADGFRTRRIHTPISPPQADGSSPADGVVITRGPGSAEFSGQAATVLRDVSRFPWPVGDGFTPAGFDVALTNRFAAVSTIVHGRPPLEPGGRPARLLHMPDLAALRASPHAVRRQLQQFTGLLDHPDNHQDIRLRAAVLSHAAAVGLPVCLNEDRGLRGFLPDAVLDLWLNTRPADLLDPHHRACIACSQWSAVHDQLSMRTIWDRLLKASGRQGLPPRSISVLVATKRPEMISIWAPLLAAQTCRNFEVIAALHGSRFQPADEAVARSWLGSRLTVIRVPEECVLGDVLNRATSAAAGELLVKWDDDDLYSSGHLSDLARTYEYAGTTIVGKALEFIYLASRNITLRISLSAAERRSTHCTGNTLCLSRKDLEDLGGWRPQPDAVDTHLIKHALAQGGQVYQAAGFGHLVLRSSHPGHGHTWKAAEKFLMNYSRASRPGADASFAGVDVSRELVNRWAAMGRPATDPARQVA